MQIFVRPWVEEAISPLFLCHNGEARGGMIGRERNDCTSLFHWGLAVALFIAEARSGWAFELPTDALTALVRRDEEFATRLERYRAWRNVQSAMIAASGRAGNIEQNLARELLMLHDRIDGDKTVATHEELGAHINVRR